MGTEGEQVYVYLYKVPVWNIVFFFPLLSFLSMME